MLVPTASAHLEYKVKNDTVKERVRVQEKNLAHVKYVCKHGGGYHKHWSCKARTWIAKELHATQAKIAFKSAQYWINKQIAVATQIARNAVIDPWPNCPDPHFNGATWQDTVNCENRGNWMDSPGFYRCGLQFHPNWERKYGRLCP